MDTQSSIEDIAGEACARYVKKHGVIPTRIETHPSVEPCSITFRGKAVSIAPGKAILLHHYMVVYDPPKKEIK